MLHKFQYCLRKTWQAQLTRLMLVVCAARFSLSWKQSNVKWKPEYDVIRSEHTCIQDPLVMWTWGYVTTPCFLLGQLEVLLEQDIFFFRFPNLFAICTDTFKYNQQMVCWEARAGRGELCSTPPAILWIGILEIFSPTFCLKKSYYIYVSLRVHRH
jgi:hypothetical protein